MFGRILSADETVAIENTNSSDSGGISYWGPWVYVQASGGWISISGKIDLRFYMGGQHHHSWRSYSHCLHYL